MKKLLKLLLSIIMFASISKVMAQEITLTYSDWSMLYPSNIDEVFIESEVRYKWYKIKDGQVEYIDEYYTDLAGYTKDEASARTFYRYITNKSLLFNGNNQLVLDTEYCIKSFCYLKRFQEPILLDISEKDVNTYEIDKVVEVNNEVVPFTGDNIIYYFIAIILSAIIVGIILIIKKSRKMLYE